MNLVELTESIVKSVVSNPDMVSVKEFEPDHENEVLIQVMVDESDMGSVIGKNGKIATAIRTLVQASSFIKDNKRVKINIDSF